VQAEKLHMRHKLEEDQG